MIKEQWKASYGTTVIAYSDAESIYIAADSMVKFIDSSLQKVSELENKIGLGSNLIFSCSGHTTFNSPEFDVYSLIQRHYNPHLKIIDNVNTLMDLIATSLMKVVETICRTSQYITDSVPGFLSVVIGAFNDSQPYLAQINFDLIKDQAGLYKINPVPQGSGGSVTITIGHADTVKRILGGNKSYFKSAGSIKDALIHLISKQAISEPDHVGLPVTVAVLKSTGQPSIIN